MSDATMNGDMAGVHSPSPHLDEKPHAAGAIAFLLVLVAGLGYAAFSIHSDMDQVGEHGLAVGAFVLLGIALLIALGFEFVNGFHDTANAVATVIYTHSHAADGRGDLVGLLELAGRAGFDRRRRLQRSSRSLPVELILQVGSGAGYAMIFALLIAAIMWNLGTWALGIPNSSSHALIGSIMGVGLANQLMAPAGQATSGVDWSQAVGVLKRPALQPADGVCARRSPVAADESPMRAQDSMTRPRAKQPPPLWIRAF